MPATSVGINMHILLIEPDVIIAATYSDVLARKGRTVSSVSDAQVAVQAADIQQPDVVVLNMELARHNGIEFLYEFKSYTEWRDVPVVLLVSPLNHDLADNETLRRDLGVKQVLVQSQLTLKKLCDSVTNAGQSNS